MSLNVKKTKELCISFLKKPVQVDNLTSAGTEINIVDNFKILGGTISSDLTWNTHIDVICAKASRRLYEFSSVLGCHQRILCLSIQHLLDQFSNMHVKYGISPYHNTSTTRSNKFNDEHCELHYHICHTAMDLKPWTYKHLNNVEKITAINFIRTFLFRKIIN